MSRIDELRQKFHENPRRYFAPLANEYRKAGDPEQAIAICRAHLAQQPGHMSGHVVYGQALFDANRKEEARGVFEKALALDPDNAIVLKHLGDISREKGENSEARHWYSRAIDLDPSDREVAAYIAELTEPVTEESAPEPSIAITASEPEAPAAEPERPAPEPEIPAAIEFAREPEIAAEPEMAPVDTDSAPAPAEDDVAWRKTPPHEDSPFVTRTMAELYASQGYREAALDVYRQLALHHPEDKEIFDRIEALQKRTPTEAAAPQPAEAAGTEPIAPTEPSAMAPEEPSATAPEGPAATPPAEPQAAQMPEAPPELVPFEPLISDLPVEPEAMEIDQTAAFAPTDEDMNLHVTPSGSTPHFTEMELGSTGDSWDSDSWGAGFDSDETIETEFDSPDTPASPPETAAASDAAPAETEPPPVAEQVPAPEPVTEAEGIHEQLESPSIQPTADIPESPSLQAIEESEESAPEPDIPVITEPVAQVAYPSHEIDVEPAAALPPEPAPEEEEPAYEPEPEEASFVAYSPQLPEKEDLPHYAPKHPTVREFFATLGAFRPSERGSSITAHAAIPETAPSEQQDEYPLATDAFANLFGDEPVSEEDTRAAFALSGAIGASTPPSNVAVSAPAEPQPAPEPPPSNTPAQESEEDIRRFREWLDGLAES